ncbi:CotO family spore coat protein [Halobacillus sp. BBL2006]|uniref:CotO family spore coat protein n=1 Tax=Halobacillus sp. BBL2006 TaxID=1543706 RepID=UPI0005426814|nr:CotO family spore coat protein [Halobacillus sp. BBL2006]KHE72054.1 hypothetical protein LD39_06555 [Halobacillus sp. BBL2006]
MAEKKRLAKQPMLYIAQPEFKPAEVPMQTSFRSQRSSSSQASSGGGTSIQEKELRLRNQSAAPVEKEEPKAEQEEQEVTTASDNADSKTKSPRERRQRFQDLDLEGKVNYFFQLSPHVPKMKCEVSTEDESYRGYITDYKDGIVTMKVFQRPYHQDVPFEKIKEIRLIGF